MLPQVLVFFSHLNFNIHPPPICHTSFQDLFQELHQSLDFAAALGSRVAGLDRADHRRWLSLLGDQLRVIA